MSKMDKVKNKVFWRWYFLGGAGWNYEKMQGLGYYFSMLPMIKKQKTEEDQKKMAQTQLQFFNTNNTMAPIIMGVDNALQEEKGVEAADTIAAIKTGMMGPLAGIGDTLFHVIPSTYGTGGKSGSADSLDLLWPFKTVLYEKILWNGIQRGGKDCQ